MAGCSTTLDPEDGAQLCASSEHSKRCPAGYHCYQWLDGKERCARNPPDDAGAGSDADTETDAATASDANVNSDANEDADVETDAETGPGGDADVGTGGSVPGSGFTLQFADEFTEPTVKASPFTLSDQATDQPFWYYAPPYDSSGMYSHAIWDSDVYSVQDGVLSITASMHADGEWHSGVLSSLDPNGQGFAAHYGYFEIRCRLPNSGTGAWPSFQLLSRNTVLNFLNGTAHPVIDVKVFEWWGAYSERNWTIVGQKLYTTVPSDGPDDAELHQPNTNMPNNALPWQDFHTYALQVDPEHVTWFIDGQQTAQITTPHLYHQSPLYILIAYAVGGAGWGTEGMVNGSTLDIDWVRVYSLPEDTGCPTPTGSRIATGNLMAPDTCLLPGQSLTSANGLSALVCGGTDGDLALYAAGSLVWHSGASSPDLAGCVMEADGNLVLYGSAGNVLQESQTSGNPNSYLTVQDNCKLVIRNADDESTWSMCTWNECRCDECNCPNN